MYFGFLANDDVVEAIPPVVAPFRAGTWALLVRWLELCKRSASDILRMGKTVILGYNILAQLRLARIYSITHI